VSIHYINVGQAAAAIVDLKGAAIMIDAGGETTENNEYADHLIDYLNRFFQDRRSSITHSTDHYFPSAYRSHEEPRGSDAILYRQEPRDGGDDSGSGFPHSARLASSPAITIFRTSPFPTPVSAEPDEASRTPSTDWNRRCRPAFRQP
jgi:hypothetical protein